MLQTEILARGMSAFVDERKYPELIDRECMVLDAMKILKDYYKGDWLTDVGVGNMEKLEQFVPIDCVLDENLGVYAVKSGSVVAMMMAVVKNQETINVPVFLAQMCSHDLIVARNLRKDQLHSYLGWHRIKTTNPNQIAKQINKFLSAQDEHLHQAIVNQDTAVWALGLKQPELLEDFAVVYP